MPAVPSGRSVRERPVAVVEGVHLLRDDVGRLADAAREQLGRLEDRRADLAVAEAGEERCATASTACHPPVSAGRMSRVPETASITRSPPRVFGQIPLYGRSNQVLRETVSLAEAAEKRQTPAGAHGEVLDEPAASGTPAMGLPPTASLVWAGIGGALALKTTAKTRIRLPAATYIGL